MVQALNFEKLCGAQDEVGGASGQVYSFQLFLLAPFLTLPADDCLMYHDWYQHYRWVQVSQWITHNFFGSGAGGINNSLLCGWRGTASALAWCWPFPQPPASSWERVGSLLSLLPLFSHRHFLIQHFWNMNSGQNLTSWVCSPEGSGAQEFSNSSVSCDRDHRLSLVPAGSPAPP